MVSTLLHTSGIRILNLKTLKPTTKEPMETTRAVLAIGRQWVTNSGFTMDLFIGGLYSKGGIETEEGATGENFDVAKFEGFRIRTEFSIGFAF